MRITVRASIVVLLVAGSHTAYSAEWKIEPVLHLKGGYDDNVRFAADNEISSAVGIFSPSATFSVTTPTSGASGNVRFDFRRYEADSDLNDNNSLLNLNLQKSFERSRLGLDLAYVNDTTLDSQLEETGLVFDRVQRTRFSGNPSWTWRITERTSFQARYSYSDVSYEDAGGTGFVDYNLHNAALTLSRIVTERATASITVSGARSDNDNDVQSTNGSFQGGISYNASETLQVSAFAGVRNTEIDYSTTSFDPVFSGTTIIGFIPVTQDVTNSDWGGTFSASVTKKFLRGQTGLSASRDISNSINGTPIEVDRYRWLNEYHISDLLTVMLNLELYNSRFSNSLGQNQDRTYYQIRPGLTWKLTEFWHLSGNYSYRKQSLANNSNDPERNAAYLTLTYHWPRIAVSR